MSKKAVRILATLIIAGLVIVLFLFQDRILGKDNPVPNTKAANTESADAPPLPVEAIIVQSSELLDAIFVSGSTIPNEEVAITTEVAGKIVDIRFKEGEFASKGKTLVRLDDEELQAERKRLVVQRNLNDKIAERLKALYEKEGVSLQDYEVAAAEVDKTDADIALLDAQLQKRTISAPFSGRLGLRMVSEGSYLAPGTPIVQLVSVNPIKLEFDVPEKYSNAIAAGTKVRFRLDGNEEAYQATVTAAEPNINTNTRTLRFRATAPNPNGRILPGAFANVEVALKSYESTLLIPTQAIIPDVNEKTVLVFRNGKAEVVTVKTGIRRNQDIQVLSGLSQGDTVIVTGLMQIKPGEAVNISNIKQP